MRSTVRVRSMILCALFAALIAVGAFLRIPFPGVPFTLQTFFVLLAGFLLGPRLGAVSVALYLAVGLSGIPVFALGGGFSYVLQPTFGYLLGFCLGAWVVGKISRHPSLKRLWIAGLAGLAVIYLVGMVYFYWISNFYTQTPIGLRSLFLSCFALTAPGDIILCSLAVLLTRRLNRIL